MRIFEIITEEEPNQNAAGDPQDTYVWQYLSAHEQLWVELGPDPVFKRLGVAGNEEMGWNSIPTATRKEMIDTLRKNDTIKKFIADPMNALTTFVIHAKKVPGL
jgi:hypothetical protein